MRVVVSVCVDSVELRCGDANRATCGTALVLLGRALEQERDSQSMCGSADMYPKKRIHIYI